MANMFVQVPTWLISKICRSNLNGREIRILLWIIRQTHGFHKESDNLSSYQLANATDIDRRSVVRILKSLEEEGYIKVQKTKKNVHKITVLGSGKSATGGSGKSASKGVVNLPPTKYRQKGPSSELATLGVHSSEVNKDDNWIYEEDFDD